MSRRIVVEIVGDSASLERTFNRSARAGQGFDRSMSRVTRGVLAGSGAFQHLGRSIAFASGGFLAFASAGDVIRKSIDAARSAAVSQRALARQMQTSGASFKAWQGTIEQADLKLSHLSGFTGDALEQSLTTLDRSTGNINVALRLNAIAADVARGRHISLAQAAIALGKAYGGQATALKRLGIQVPKGASGMDAIRIAAERFAGQAKAGATASDRFGAELHNSEVIIGQGLLPTLNKYLAKGTNWLDQMNRSGRLQRDVAAATQTLGQIIQGLKAIVVPVTHAFEDFSKVVGGAKHAVELLGTAFLILKARTQLTNWGVLGSEVGMIGTRAKTSTGQVNSLRGALLGLNGLVVRVAIVEEVIKHVVPGHSSMGLDFSEPTAGDTIVTIGGQQYVKGSPAAADALRRQRFKSKYGVQIPGDFNLFGVTTKRKAGSGARSPGVGLPPDIPQSASGNVPAVKGKKTKAPFTIPNRVSGSFLFGETTFQVPAGLQLAEARANALGQSLDPILARERAAARRALHSGLLAIQGQIDAWNLIADVNSRLAGQTTSGVSHFHAVSTRALTAGLHLSHAKRLELEARLAQAEAHGGVPSGTFALGQPVQVTTHIDLDGRRIADVVTNHQQKKAGRARAQTRGGNAGRNLGLH